VDTIIEQAAGDEDPVIRALANSIRNRRPPKLIREVLVLEQSGKSAHAGALFKKDCKHQLKGLAEKYRLPLGKFLVCETRPLTLEQRGALLTEDQARSLEPEEREEIIKVFVGGNPEPVSVVTIPHSLVHLCSNHFFQAFRLYLVCDHPEDEGLVDRIRGEVAAW
jgi:hypothetical protein